MKIVIPGGTGHLGGLMRRALVAAGHRVVLVGRGDGEGVVRWDGRTLGPWAEEIDGADVVLNLAGRSVDCRYSTANLREMTDSRVFSTRAVGRAIEIARRPPRVWLQMSTATIYAHRYDAPNDERTGRLGGDERDVPAYWRYSTDIAIAWERELREAATPNTRKVALRTAMVMSTVPRTVFPVLLGLTRLGLGGAHAGGTQYVSWMHEDDFARSVEFLIEHEDLDGPVNLAAPGPVPQREFMAALRRAWGIRWGLPANRWLLEIGAWVRRSDTELLLKSRRVIPGRLLGSGFRFLHPEWEGAAQDLVSRWRRERRAPHAQANGA